MILHPGGVCLNITKGGGRGLTRAISPFTLSPNTLTPVHYHASSSEAGIFTGKVNFREKMKNIIKTTTIDASSPLLSWHLDSKTFYTSFPPLQKCRRTSYFVAFFVAKMPSHIVQCESAHIHCFVLLMLRKRSFKLCCGASIRKGCAHVAQTEPTAFCDLRDVGL